MIPNAVTIASRKSPLAMWQSKHVQTQLKTHHPTLMVEILGLLTQGDKQLATPLYDIGGKALFVKELEKAILERRADLAVHSIKDMPAELPDGLHLGVICEREDPRDALVAAQADSLAALPKGAIVGTSSLRRQCQIKALRPDLTVKPLRGNVGTRLSKLDDGQYDAIILAVAGLRRLQLAHRITEILDPTVMVPAAGQGAVGIECRSNDAELAAVLKPLDHAPTRVCIQAERYVTAALGGSCKVPLGAYATLEGDQIQLRAMVGTIDGSTLLRAEHTGAVADVEGVARAVAEDLLSQGALGIIQAYL